MLEHLRFYKNADNLFCGPSSGFGVLLFLILLCILPLPVFAKSSRLVVLREVTIFSGPGFNFRPIKNANSGDQFPASTKQVAGTDGTEFVKVLIKGKKGPPRVGFIPATDRVSIEEPTSDTQDDVDSYIPLSQADSSLTVSFSGYTNSNYLWTFGYLKYPAPDFYLRALVGQLLYKRAGSPLFGMESGFEQPAFDKFSVYAQLLLGAVNVPVKDDIFEGSSSLNFLSQAGFGIRYTADQSASVSFGPTQIAIFSPNGSYLSLGGTVSLEVGL